MVKKTPTIAPARFTATSWWKVFWKNLVASFSDLHYYAAILNFPLKKSFKLTLGFYFLVAIWLSTKLYIWELPEFEQHAQQLSTELISAFPEHIEINWDGQQLYTQPPEKIEVNVPDSANTNDNAYKLLIVDTEQTATPDPLNSFIYITQNTLYSSDLQGNHQSFSLQSVLEEENFTVTRQTLVDQSSGFFTWYEQTKAWIPIFMLPIFWLGIFLLRTIMIAIDSVILHFVFTLLNRPLPYKKVFQLSWHVLLPAEVIHQISIALYPQLNFPMLSVAYWVLMLCIMWHFRNLRVVKIEPVEKK